MSSVFKLGIDSGSTTVKIVLLDENEQPVYQRYCRHHADILGTLAMLLQEAGQGREDIAVRAAVTGSAAMAMAERLGLPFVQEVIAETKAINRRYPQTDVIIELGGEDAKVTYLGRSTEHRMNGSCAGGTGAFIDQMATLLQTDAAGLNELARNSDTSYPIAARCGVFAKTDVQALLNQGASKENIAHSVFQAIVNQTITGLACGRRIEGNVAFLGGPLSFLDDLRNTFATTLNLPKENQIIPPNGELFIALGAAFCSDEAPVKTLGQLLQEVTALQGQPLEHTDRLEPLFHNETELDEFRQRHGEAIAAKGDLATTEGPCFLGLDAGSTTIKAIVMNSNKEIVYSYYGPNRGKPLSKAKEILADIYAKLPEKAYIARSGVTGYGEALLQRALAVDTGEVETIAHYEAAKHFCPDVSFILDIGGQDMKCCYIRDGYIEDIVLNEACSSGCGSFLDTFAASLGLTIDEFAKKALTAKAPIDLGSRCTVFMNSKVKQAQKEGAAVEDIAAGLAYSVIKNALYKVIKVNDPKTLGKHVVVQGGTFYNEAVLRAFEALLGTNVIRPDTAGLMGAYGMALIAAEQFDRQPCASTLLTPDVLATLTVDTTMRHCGLCANNCMLTINTFSDGRSYVSGNRCDRGAGNMIQEKAPTVPNLVTVKLHRLFDYYNNKGVAADESKGRIGLPRVLNMYEDYPFWFTFFTKLGYEVVLSSPTTPEQYTAGMDTIPSDTACYPAKSVHGHIAELVRRHVDFIFYPCIQCGPVEYSKDNHYHCPMVMSYPELIRHNMEEVLGDTPIYTPFLPLDNKERLIPRLAEELASLGVSKSAVKDAVEAAWTEQETWKADYREMTRKTIERIKAKRIPTIVLAGRPYHLDPGINHGIPELIASLGMAVLTEDGVAPLGEEVEHLRVVDQWSYHSRLYRAADFVSRNYGFQLVELNSFGCGLDSVVADQVKEILAARHKIHTVLKIDEGTNLGAVTIRLRSLQSVMKRNLRNNTTSCHNTDGTGYSYERAVFTKAMKEEYTILVPQMSPYHFPLLDSLFIHEGYKFALLPHPGRAAIECGLKFIHNDACYPAVMMIGQIMYALQPGKYDVNKTAVIVSQTGGGCRATNYIGYLRKALNDAGLSQVPILSLNSEGLEKQPGFTMNRGFVNRILQGLIYGDTLMQCVLATRPYETVKGSVEALFQKWLEKLKKDLLDADFMKYCRNVANIVKDFEALPAAPRTRPKVGIVGEIYVKFHPDANNHIIRRIEQEGGEVITSGLMDFFLYCSMDAPYRTKYLAGSWLSGFLGNVGRHVLDFYRHPYVKAMKKSKRFDTPESIKDVAKRAAAFINLGNQSGEGWFLTGDMLDLIHKGARHVVCLQPFGCLPNHVTGKGMIRPLSEAYPDVRIAAIDYDPGASEVNQTNRLKLLLGTLFEGNNAANA